MRIDPSLHKTLQQLLLLFLLSKPNLSYQSLEDIQQGAQGQSCKKKAVPVTYKTVTRDLEYIQANLFKTQ